MRGADPTHWPLLEGDLGYGLVRCSELVASGTGGVAPFVVFLGISGEPGALAGIGGELGNLAGISGELDKTIASFGGFTEMFVLRSTSAPGSSQDFQSWKKCRTMVR